MKLDKLLLNCIYCTNVPILKLLISYTVELRQHQKKYYPLRIEFVSTVASSKKCSEFQFISLFIFLSKHKAFYKHNFLEGSPSANLLRQLKYIYYRFLTTVRGLS